MCFHTTINGHFFQYFQVIFSEVPVLSLSSYCNSMARHSLSRILPINFPCLKSKRKHEFSKDANRAEHALCYLLYIILSAILLSVTSYNKSAIPVILLKNVSSISRLKKSLSAILISCINIKIISSSFLLSLSTASGHNAIYVLK